MNFIKKGLHRFVFLVAMFSLPIATFAQSPTATGGGSGCDYSGGKICNPIPAVSNIPALIQIILVGVIKIGIPIIALAIIYSGFLFVAAQGNSEKLKTAKNALVYTIIGAAILLGSWAIAKLISETVLGLS